VRLIGEIKTATSSEKKSCRILRRFSELNLGQGPALESLQVNRASTESSQRGDIVASCSVGGLEMARPDKPLRENTT